MYELKRAGAPKVTRSTMLKNNGVTPNLVYTETVTRGNLAWNEFRQGVDLPKYREIIEKGGDATTAFTAQRGFLTSQPSTCVLHWHYVATPKVRCTTTLTDGLTIVRGLPSIAAPSATGYNLAIQGMNKKIQNARQSFDGLVFIGELGETLSMVKSPIQALRKGYASYISSVIKRSRGRKASDLNRIITETYLEFTFGWEPLMSDIKELLELALKQRNNLSALRLTSLGTASAAKEVLNSQDSTGQFWYMTHVIDRVDSVTRLISGFEPGTLDVPPSLMESLGLRPSRLIPTVWELIPYSFLVDYFANVGAILDAISNLSYQPSWTCKTVRDTSVRNVMCRFDALKTKTIMGSGYEDSSGDIGSSQMTLITVNRSSVKLPLPTLEFRIPTRWRQWVNMAALLLQTKNASRVIVKAMNYRPQTSYKSIY